MKQADREAHYEFIDTYVGTMVKLEHFEAFFPREMSRDFGNALPEVLATAAEVKKSLAAGSMRLDEKLKQHGLGGLQLQLKRKGMARARDAWHVKGSVVDKALRRLLRWLNLYLGSLSSIVGGAGLLKEFKDAIEIGLDEADGVFEE